MVGEGGSRTDGLSVDAAAPHRGGILLRRIDADAERDKPEHAFDLGMNRPGPVALGESKLVHGCAMQAAARRQKRDRLDQVRLASAVGASKHHRSRACEFDLSGAIATEIV